MVLKVDGGGSAVKPTRSTAESLRPVAQPPKSTTSSDPKPRVADDVQAGSRQRAVSDPNIDLRRMMMHLPPEDRAAIEQNLKYSKFPRPPVGLPVAAELGDGQSVTASAKLRGPNGTSLDASVTAMKAVQLQPGLESNVTLTVSAQTSVGVSGDVKFGNVGVGGSAASGQKNSYSVTIPEEHYNAIRDGRAPMPNPFDPESMPNGSGALMKEEDFSSSSLSASYKQIRLDTSHTESSGTAIGVNKIDDKHIRVFAGPTEAVNNSMLLGVNAGPLTLGVGASNTSSLTKCGVVDIDISTAEGKQAYNDFLRTGKVPPSSPPGVANSGVIETYDGYHQASASAQIKIGDFKIGGSTELNSSDLNVRQTSYDDGRKVYEQQYRINDVTLVSTNTTNPDGSEDASKAKTQILFNGVDDVSAAYLKTAFTGAEYKKTDGSQDVQLTLTQGDVEGLKDRVRALVDERQMPLGVGPSDYLYQSILDAKSPSDVALAFVNQSSSGWAAESLLTLAVSGGGFQPLPGKLEMVNDQR